MTITRFDILKSNKKKCAVCGKTFSRGEGESPSKWIQRKCCGHICAGKIRHTRSVIVFSIKTCMICGAKFSNTTNLSIRGWNLRSCCSTDCARHAKRKNGRNRFPDMPEEELRTRIAEIRSTKESKGEKAWGDHVNPVQFDREFHVTM